MYSALLSTEYANTYTYLTSLPKTHTHSLTQTYVIPIYILIGPRPFLYVGRTNKNTPSILKFAVGLIFSASNDKNFCTKSQTRFSPNNFENRPIYVGRNLSCVNESHLRRNKNDVYVYVDRTLALKIRSVLHVGRIKIIIRSPRQSQKTQRDIRK